MDPAALEALCARGRSGYKRPTSYVVVEALPKSTADKIAVRAAHAAVSAAA